MFIGHQIAPVISMFATVRPLSRVSGSKCSSRLRKFALKSLTTSSSTSSGKLLGTQLVQSSELLLGLASAVVLGSEPCRDPRPILRVLKSGFLFDKKRGLLLLTSLSPLWSDKWLSLTEIVNKSPALYGTSKFTILIRAAMNQCYPESVYILTPYSFK
jgi:hypothetical protein